jgi:hypothetical protein
MLSGNLRADKTLDLLKKLMQQIAVYEQSEPLIPEPHDIFSLICGSGTVGCDCALSLLSLHLSLLE